MIQKIADMRKELEELEKFKKMADITGGLFALVFFVLPGIVGLILYCNNAVHYTGVSDFIGVFMILSLASLTVISVKCAIERLETEYQQKLERLKSMYL